MIPWLATAAWAEPMTVDAAIARALAANPIVEQSDLAARIAAIQLDRARLDRFGLVLGAVAGASERVTVPLDGSPSYDAQSASWDVRGTATLPIYQGGAIQARIDQAAATASSQDLARRLTERDIAQAVVLGYWTIQGFELQIEAAEEALSVTREALAIIEARAAAGLAAQIDVNRSRVDVFQQEAQLLDLEYGRFQGREDLARLLHLPSEEVVLTEPVPAIDAPAGGPPAGDGAARLELDQRAAEIAVAEAGVRLARSAALPQLSLTADVGLGAIAVGGGPDGFVPAPTFDAGDLAPALDAGIGVAFSWTPFDLFRTRQNVEIARLGVRQAEAATRSQEDRVRQEVATAAEQLDVTRQRAAVVSRQLDLARENLEIIQALYSQGNTTILELFQAQSSFRQARSQAASVAVDLVTAEWDLRFALGTDPVTESSP